MTTPTPESPRPTPGAAAEILAHHSERFCKNGIYMTAEWIQEVIDREIGVRELLKDKARLDWLEQAFGLMIWRGVIAKTKENVYTLHDVREEGIDDACGDELGTGDNLRQAIDAAIARCEGKVL